MVKQILSVFVWIVSAVGLVLLLAFARHEYLKSPVTGLDVVINRKNQAGFLNQSKLIADVIALTDSIEGKPIRHFRLREIKERLQKNPWVDEADISTTINGRLKIRVKERNAYIRAYNRKNESIYIDHSGTIFPVNAGYASRVIIASGYLDFPVLSGKKTASIFDSVYRKTELPDLFRLNNALQADAFLSVLIDQIYVNSLHEIELTPKIGSATVVLGSLELLPEKLLHLKAFYKQKALSEELIQYQRINLKFSNQIVCTKR